MKMKSKVVCVDIFFWKDSSISVRFWHGYGIKYDYSRGYYISKKRAEWLMSILPHNTYKSSTENLPSCTMYSYEMKHD